MVNKRVRHIAAPRPQLIGLGIATALFLLRQAFNNSLLSFYILRLLSCASRMRAILIEQTSFR